MPLALIGALLISGPVALAATVGPTDAASAHTGTVKVSANCLPDGTREVTYTGATTNVPTSGSGHTAKLTVGEILPVNTVVTPAVQTVVGNTSYTWTQIVPGTAKSAQSTAFLVWGDGAKQDPIGQITFPSDCKPVVAPPTQTVTCDVISGNYNRPLTNGDHINATITPPGSQVNMYVDQNVAGGASYNGQNNLGLRWKILGVEQTPIPLTLEQVKAGIISLPYGAVLKKTQATWTVSFVQTNETDTWPEFNCNTNKEDAAATVSVKTVETCFSSSTVVATLVNAKLADGQALDQTVGTHTVTYKADFGHVFAGGKDTLAVTYTIKAADPSLCAQDASASVKIDQKESCLADTTVKFDLANATWDKEADLSVGTHTRTATAVKNHLFAGGLATASVTYTIKAADPALCPKDASASVSIDKAVTCDTNTDVSFALAHATWDEAADLSVGTHTRNATADAGFNFPNGTKHFGVTYTIEKADPSLCPQDAIATVSVKTAATCDTSSVVVATTKFATLVGTLDQTVGAHTATFKADAKHLFSTGNDTITVKYTIEAANPALCPQDAVATASIDQQATCLVDSTVKFTLANATWATEPVLTDGDHTLTAIADKGHLFAGGKSTLEVLYNIKKADPALCPGAATASASVESVATCTSSSVPSFAITNATWDKEADLSVGTHTRTATAKDNFVFPDKSTSIKVTYTVVAADPALCPKDASASVSIDKAATCLASETVKLTPVNATLVGALDQTVGTHKATLNAATGHLFADGTSQTTVSYTVKDKVKGGICNPIDVLASTGVDIRATLGVLVLLLAAGAALLIAERKRRNKGTGTI